MDFMNGTISSMVSLPDPVEIKKKLDSKISKLIEKALLNYTNSHIGISCDYCGKKDFRDFRYKCILCEDYDLCSECFEHKRENKSHRTCHAVILLTRPIPRSDNRVLNLIFSMGPEILTKVSERNVFKGISCDVCKQCPIRGLRIKCDECNDYDLCWNCYAEGATSKSHLLDHCVIVELFPASINHFDIATDIKFLAPDEDEKRGCFGSVKKVLFRSNQVAALKKITIKKTGDFDAPRLLKSYQNELFAYHELKSIHILSYYGTSISVQGDLAHLYLLTEFMDNGCLQEVIREKQDHSLRRKFQWLLGIIKGLRRMHEKGFVHKDIKPDNILLDKYLDAKIGDMGIAIHNEGKQYFYEQIAPVHYAAPEILNGNKFTTKVDIFSLGLLINELFTYKTHRRGSQVQFIEKTRVFWPLVEKCVQTDYKSRPSAALIEKKFDEFDKFFWNNLSMKATKYIVLPLDEKNIEFMRIYEKAAYKKILDF